MKITTAEREAIRAKDNDNLEQEIANCYYRAHWASAAARVEETEGSRIAALWEEFDLRYEEGTIERDPDTGNEVDDDDDAVWRIY